MNSRGADVAGRSGRGVGAGVRQLGAAPAGAHQRLHAGSELPQIICRAAKRILDFLGEEGTHVAHHGAKEAHDISTLVVRQYEQVTDDAIKTHCLNLIDQMERVGYFGIGEEPAKINR